MNENMPSPTKIAVPPASAHSGCDIMVGTCGYSYLEWVDSGFYPPATKSSEMLGLYGGCFSIVELNYTWYQMARSDALSRMADAAPPTLAGVSQGDPPDTSEAKSVLNTVVRSDVLRSSESVPSA